MTDKQRAIVHYGRSLVPKRRVVDMKGAAIALVFLIAMSLWAGWRRDQISEQVVTWQEPPELSDEITIRPPAKHGLEGASEQALQPFAGLTGALHDPRQAR
jgi:hypothetical protein